MDPIADMLVRIKNAQAAHKETVAFGYSKIKWEIAKLLEHAAYIAAVNKKGKKNRKLVEVSLLYDAQGAPKIVGVKRVSSPGRRVYKGSRDIYPIRNGAGVALYSTPKGVLLDKDARKEKVGGEVLCEIW
jgi:small subunit ribosomal protein S8